MTDVFAEQHLGLGEVIRLRRVHCGDPPENRRGKGALTHSRRCQRRCCCGSLRRSRAMRRSLKSSQLVPDGFIVDHVDVGPGQIDLLVRSGAASAPCPSCLAPSRRVQSRYRRHVAELPLGGRRVHIQVVVRRFRCETASCERHIFAERFRADVLPVFGRTGPSLVEGRRGRTTCHRERRVSLGGDGTGSHPASVRSGRIAAALRHERTTTPPIVRRRCDNVPRRR